tara:strand:+ start:3487 stop:3960 length:474 start_codon:yes stop_codon:yes gene_type:complete
MYELNKWGLWYHSINDTDWGQKSYNSIYTIHNLFDYQYIIDIFKQDHYQNGMFFLMREDIFPNWEDPENRNGGCLSFKIPSDRIVKEWNDLFLKCITENILIDHNKEVNGISISPKKEFNIIKIWFREHTFDYSKAFHNDTNSYIKIENALYKKHSF